MRSFVATMLVLVLAACGDDDAGARDAGTPDSGAPDAGPMLIAPPDERAPCALHDPLRRPLFGDLHVHTARSFDAAAYDVRTGPRDAYAFARGAPIGLPPYDAEGRPTRTLQLARPLDFAAITDHSEFLGEIAICTDPSSPGFDSRTCETWREGRGRAGRYGELTGSLALAPPRRPTLCRGDPELCASRLETVWQEMNDAAEEVYDRSDACSFTSFIGYEWTGSAGGDNIHRNVLFRTRTVPRWPVSYVEAWTPERLWDALEGGCLEQPTPEGAAPCDLLVIPHNGNLGAGSMFVPVRDDGTPYDRADAERRARLEPLIEIYQHKGSSECLDTRGDPLGSEDELCRFEELHPSVCRGLPDDPEGCAESCSEGGGIGFLGGCVAGADFARGMLRTGLAERARVGANPFEVGFLGSTDTHQSLAGGVDEPSFRGHLGDSEDEPSEQLDAEAGVLIRGLTVSAGGLAVVWAEENSRDSIFAALRRRETYATSGTRIVVRTFAGAGIPSDACASTELARIGYEGGVPMGGDIDTRAGTPRIVVAAQRDPMGAPLERIQLVIGTLEADGTTREQVIDVAGTEVTEQPDATTCAPPAGGADQLCAVHELSELDATRPAFVYARVLEVPTCRWSHYVCAESGVDCATVSDDDPRAVCCGDRARHVIRERAWTSPVWWTPQ